MKNALHLSAILAALTTLLTATAVAQTSSRGTSQVSSDANSPASVVVSTSLQANPIYEQANVVTFTDPNTSQPLIVYLPGSIEKCAQQIQGVPAIKSAPVVRVQRFSLEPLQGQGSRKLSAQERALLLQRMPQLQGQRPQNPGILVLPQGPNVLIAPPNGNPTPLVGPQMEAGQPVVRNLLFTPEDAARTRVFHPLLTPESQYGIIQVRSGKDAAIHRK